MVNLEVRPYSGVGVLALIASRLDGSRLGLRDLPADQSCH